MSNNRYVILNCPTLMGNRLCFGKTTKQCADCTDCLLKQIVERCKENLNSLETYVDVRSLECVTLQNILKLLEIQEVE